MDRGRVFIAADVARSLRSVMLAGLAGLLVLTACSSRPRVTILSAFGDPYQVGSRSLRVVPNRGLDIGGYPGRPVIAPADGTVRAWINEPSCGRGLLLDHGDFQGAELQTAYCHLSEVLSPPGARVRRGETIGLIGLTGDTRASHPHLHFEVRTVWAGREKAIDPHEVLVGCFDPALPYPTRQLVLTYPIQC